MNCSTKLNDFGTTFRCTEVATKEITVTTLVPHLGNKKQVDKRCLCDFHAKRFRNKLNYQINNMNKTKSYVEINI